MKNPTHTFSLIFVLIVLGNSCNKKQDYVLITYETNLQHRLEKDYNGIDTSFVAVSYPLSKSWENNSSDYIIHHADLNTKDTYFTSSFSKEKITIENIDTAKYTITELPEKKEILGFNCKKASIVSSNDSLVVYYTNEIKSNYSPLGNIGGCVLEYTQNSKYFSKHSKAVDISLNAINEIVIPDDYRKTTTEDYIKELNEFQYKKQSTDFVEVGQQAPKFTIPDLYGNKIDIEEKRGKVLVFNFWFIACAPCVEEIPELNKLVAAFENRENVEFYAFASNDQNKLFRFLRRKPFDFTIIPQASNIHQLYGVNAFPSTVIIDKNGKIVKTYEFKSIDSSEVKVMVKEIEELLSSGS